MSHLSESEIQGLKNKAKNLRIDIIKMITKANSGHTGGSLSVIDLLTLLFFKEMKVNPAQPQDKERDRFVLSKRLKIFRRFVHRHCLYPLLKIIRNRHSLRNQIITSKMEPLYHRIQDCSIHIKNVKFCVLRQHFTYIIPIHDSEILSMFYDRIYHPFIRSCYTNTIFVSDHPTLYISCYTNLGSIFDHLALTYNLIFFQCITTLYFDSISRVNSTSFFVAAPGSS